MYWSNFRLVDLYIFMVLVKLHTLIYMVVFVMSALGGLCRHISLNPFSRFKYYIYTHTHTVVDGQISVLGLYFKKLLFIYFQLSLEADKLSICYLSIDRSYCGLHWWFRCTGDTLESDTWCVFFPSVVVHPPH